MMLNIDLPPITMPCTVEQAATKFAEEGLEWFETEHGSLAELIEAWDVLQVADTWLRLGGGSMASLNYWRSARRLQAYQAMGRPVARARRIMLIKNAARGYYSAEDNERVLADV